MRDVFPHFTAAYHNFPEGSELAKVPEVVRRFAR